LIDHKEHSFSKAEQQGRHKLFKRLKENDKPAVSGEDDLNLRNIVNADGE